MEMYEYLKKNHPTFNSIADSDESYKNANYGIKDWTTYHLETPTILETL